MPTMPFSPCDTSATQCADQSVQILTQIFGPIITTLTQGGDPNTLQMSSNILATMFNSFNSGILIVAGFIVSYVALMGVANTANDGEAMGKAWSTWWTPARIVFGGGVLLPTASGYSIIQIIVFTISLWAVGFANTIYTAAMGMSMLTPSGLVQGVNQPGQYFGLRDFAREYLAASYCAKAANYLYNDPNTGQTPKVTTQPGVIDQTVTSGGNTDSVTYVSDRNSSTSLGGGAPICGTITLTSYTSQLANTLSSNSNGTTSTDPMGTALEQLHAQVQNQKVAAAKSMMQQLDAWVATWPNTAQDSGWNAVNSDQFNQIVSTAENQLATQLAQSAQNTTSSMNNGVSSFVQALTSGGWATAAGWSQRVGMVRGQITSTLGLPVGHVSGPSFSSLPWNSATEELMNSVSTVTDAINTKADQKSDYTSGPIRPTDLASLIPKDPKSDINPGALKEEMDAKMGSVVNNMMGTMVNIVTGANTGVGYNTGSTTPLCGTAGQMGGSLNRMKCVGDYMTVMHGMLMTADVEIKTAVTVLRVAAGGVSSVKGIGTGLDLDKITTPIWDWATNVLGNIFGQLIAETGQLAFYFGVFLPSLPYAIYMMVVAGWFLAVLQTSLAATLWSCMHMTPDRTFIGSQTQGYLLLLSLFARPALAVIGLVAAQLLSDPIINYIATDFFQMRAAVVSSTGGIGAVAQFFTFVWWFKMFGIILVPVLYMIYGLPQALPGHVLQWIGGGIPDLGENNAIGQIRVGMMGLGAGGLGSGGFQGLGGGRPNQGRLPGPGNPGGRPGGNRGIGYDGGNNGGPGGGGDRGGSGGLGGGGGGRGAAPINANPQGVADPIKAGPEGYVPPRAPDRRTGEQRAREGMGVMAGRGAILGAQSVGRTAGNVRDAIMNGGGAAGVARATLDGAKDFGRSMKQANSDGVSAMRHGVGPTMQRIYGADAPVNAGNAGGVGSEGADIGGGSAGVSAAAATAVADEAWGSPTTAPPTLDS